MTGFGSKMLGVLIAFTLITVPSVAYLAISQQLNMQRGALNEVANFIDKATDSNYITENDLAELKLGISKYGVVMDITVEHYVKTYVPQGTGGSAVGYNLVSLTMTKDSPNPAIPKRHRLNKGDQVVVKVRQIDYSGNDKLLMRLTNVIMPPFDITQSGYVRN